LETEQNFVSRRAIGCPSFLRTYPAKTFLVIRDQRFVELNNRAVISGPRRSPFPVTHELDLPCMALQPISLIHDDEAMQKPPDNFGVVEPGIYRAAFPSKEHFPFLKTLNLKTVLRLCPEEYPEECLELLKASGVKLLHFPMPGTRNKSGNDKIPINLFREACRQVQDPRNHPILIHCNRGKHRTGCLVGCLRKAKQWDLEAIFKEYRHFSTPKERDVDMEFIKNFTFDDQDVATGQGSCLQQQPSVPSSAVSPSSQRSAQVPLSRSLSPLRSSLSTVLEDGEMVFADQKAPLYLSSQSNGNDPPLDPPLDHLRANPSLTADHDYDNPSERVPCEQARAGALDVSIAHQLATVSKRAAAGFDILSHDALSSAKVLN